MVTVFEEVEAGRYQVVGVSGSEVTSRGADKGEAVDGTCLDCYGHMF